jgi:beta-galactosidase
VIGEATMRTAGEARTLRLTPDRTSLSADGMDLSYVLIEAYDEEDVPVPTAMNRVRLSVTGAGGIGGVGNGNPQSFEPFQADYVDLFHGKAMLIVRAGREPGTARITATSDGLASATATIEVRR